MEGAKTRVKEDFKKVEGRRQEEASIVIIIFPAGDDDYV